MGFADNVRANRERLGLSQEELARRVGLYRRRDGRLWSPCEWAHTPTIDATTDLR